MKILKSKIVKVLGIIALVLLFLSVIAWHAFLIFAYEIKDITLVYSDSREIECTDNNDEYARFGMVYGCASSNLNPYSNPIKEKKCEAGGGMYKKIGGFSQYYDCIHPFSDAGKECRSSKDCEGACILEERETRMGSCQREDTYWELSCAIVLIDCDSEEKCKEDFLITNCLDNICFNHYPCVD